MEKLKIGLLPLYIKLYDDTVPERKPINEKFVEKITSYFTARAVEVVNAPICRIESEFREAVRTFEENGVDAIVTLHLAYSPSLESAAVLAGTGLPIVVLDTTPSPACAPDSEFDVIKFNHGIHGVQDMCNLLRRNKKPFCIVAGHPDTTDVIGKAIDAVKAARMAKRMKQARIGLVGEPFVGMGDFQIPYVKLKKLIGMDVVPFDTGGEYSIPAEEIDEEYRKSREKYDVTIDRDKFARVEKVGLGVRRWVKENRLTGLTMSFSAVKDGQFFDAMPFCEACKAMENGIGYAGEGDVLTAALVGSLLGVYDYTTFCEMFCCDWKNNNVFLSHMGEFNTRCAKTKPRLITKPFIYSEVGYATFLSSPMMAGNAVTVTLLPEPDDKFTILCANVKMLDVPVDNTFSGTVNGWFRPRMPVADFLAAYSENGGIHHFAIAYGADPAVIGAFAKYMGWGFKQLC